MSSYNPHCLPCYRAVVVRKRDDIRAQVAGTLFHLNLFQHSPCGPVASTPFLAAKRRWQNTDWHNLTLPSLSFTENNHSQTFFSCKSKRRLITLLDVSLYLCARNINFEVINGSGCVCCCVWLCIITLFQCNYCLFFLILWNTFS